MGLTMDIHLILAQLSRSHGLEGMTTVLTEMVHSILRIALG